MAERSGSHPWADAAQEWLPVSNDEEYGNKITVAVVSYETGRVVKAVEVLNDKAGTNLAVLSELLDGFSDEFPLDVFDVLMDNGNLTRMKRTMPLVGGWDEIEPEVVVPSD